MEDDPAGWPPGQYRLTLSPSPHVARHVRRVVRALLRAWGMAELVDAAELAVTELLSNVVRHAPDGPCRVEVLRRPGGVRVEVRDSSPRLPEPRAAGELEGELVEELDEGGRGLPLLSMVTDAWDAEQDPAGGGKAVWFELKAGAGRVSSCGRDHDPAV